MTLTEFLLARIAEDETAAKAAADAPPEYWGDNGWSEAIRLASAEGASQEALGHIARHDPARVLADCERDRQIVELHSSDHECTAPGDGYAGVFAADGSMPSACSTMRLLALPYADHADYREEWKP